jgi:hypothetical protein
MQKKKPKEKNEINTNVRILIAYSPAMALENGLVDG